MPVPAPWGTVKLLDDQGIEMEAFIVSKGKILPNTTVYGTAVGYYRVREIDIEEPFFIFVCRETRQVTLSIDEQEAQLMEIYRFISSQFEIINYGNEQAADEILKYCKMKK